MCLDIKTLESPPIFRAMKIAAVTGLFFLKTSFRNHDCTLTKNRLFNEGPNQKYEEQNDSLRFTYTSSTSVPTFLGRPYYQPNH